VFVTFVQRASWNDFGIHSVHGAGSRLFLGSVIYTLDAR
jgi:hypothetical protein